MEIIVSFLVCLGASFIGAVCGIGGGIIIKPLLDAIGIFEFSVINFMSCCTVLSMSFYTVVSCKREEEKIDQRKSLPLAIGAAIGGIAGKSLLKQTLYWIGNEDVVGCVQASCLIIITLGTLWYMLSKDKIKTLQIIHPGICAAIGIFLGMISSFLGIGGGPVNLVVLSYFFSMNTKEAVGNSLYIILYSQLAGIIQMWITGNIPVFDGKIMFLMMSGGILGGVLGRKWNRRIKSYVVDRLFVILMLIIILINIYNFFVFLSNK